MTEHRDNIGRLPEHCRDGMLNYIENGYPVGSFLQALLSNNLKETFGCADDVNQRRVFDYVHFLYNYAPAQCWGSPEAVAYWQERGGLNGRKEA